jgi:hypothetical protein
VQTATPNYLFSETKPTDGYTMFENASATSPYMIKFPETATERKAVTRDFISEKKQEELNRVFSERQKEYETMTIRKPLHEVDFRMNIEDHPIENMDELVRSHMEYRDSILMESKPETSSVNMKLINDLNIIELDKPQQRFIQEKPFEDTNKKNVRWSSTLEQTGSARHQPMMYSKEPHHKSLLKSEHMDTRDLNMSKLKKEEGLEKHLLETLMEMKNNMHALRSEIDSLKSNRPSTNKTAAPTTPGYNPLVSNILSRLRKKPSNAVVLPEEELQNVTFSFDDLN